MEREVNLTCVLAWVMWVSTFALIGIGAVVGIAAGGDAQHVATPLMTFGLAMSAAAATVTIQAMLRKQNGLLRDAFALGRDSGQSEVRRVR